MPGLGDTNMAEQNLSDLLNLIGDLNNVIINKDNIQNNNLNEVYDLKYTEISNKINYKPKEFIEGVELVTQINDTPQWKYVFLSFHLINIIEEKLSKKSCLSIEQSKRMELCFKNLSTVGIASNILPSLPYFVSIPYFKLASVQEDTLSRYSILKYTIVNFLPLLQNLAFRPLILSSCLPLIIIGLYQLSFCPLSKPKEVIQSRNNVFNMTQELYEAFSIDQKHFQSVLGEIRKRVHPIIFIRENIVLFQSSKSPAWLLREANSLLTSIMLEEKGLIQIINVILEGFDNDNTKSWRCVEVCAKLICTRLRNKTYERQICQQLLDYLKECKLKEGNHYRAPEQVFIQCTKILYIENKELCDRMFIPKLYEYLKKFHDKNEEFQLNEDVIKNISMEVRLIHGCLVVNTSSEQSEKLPVDLIRPMIPILFGLYNYLKDVDNHKKLKSDLADIIMVYLNHIKDNTVVLFEVLDVILFNILHKGMLAFRDDIYLFPDGNNLVVKKSDQSIINSIDDSSKALVKLLENSPNLQMDLFGFYLNCLMQKDKYFPRQSNIDLLDLEDDCMNMYLKKKLHVYKALCTSAESKIVQEHIKKHPEGILKYINHALKEVFGAGIHRTRDFETHEFQTLFTTVMILQTITVTNGWIDFENLDEILKMMSAECLNDELKSLIGDILKVRNDNNTKKMHGKFSEKSDFDKALEDVCDGLLPVRGHGLMSLAKLVEKKDKITMDKKNYVLNIFHQNLKNDDSFIYLNAVRGLAALANVFTDTVLSILCEEYADFTKKFNDEDKILETRMKLGEVLVRVTKGLGDMAPKYKALLLNTFLGRSKDEDHLIRASSLSNLGEICRVLEYKLGTILSEVLVCVQSIIATDKSPEARRAAVTVLRQLFAGLGKGTIAYFREDILPVYRTLKHIYNNDKDDIMRLQAQLALEELNESMKEFVFPILSMHSEKRVVEL